jgi:hypothetical protein
MRTRMRGRAVEVVGWTAGLLALAIAAGGGASRPGGWWLGAPVGGPALAGAVAALAFAVAGGRQTGRALAGLTPIVVLVIAGLDLPGVAAFAGPPMAVLVIAAAVAAWRPRAEPPRWSAAAFLPVVALVYGLAAARAQAQVGPEGDEPHYLMVAESLLRDHDLALESDYAEGRYRAFHPAPLEPHYRVRGRGGAIYSLHAVGLSVLVLPAYALGGYAAASFFMALLAAWRAAGRPSLRRAWIGPGADGVAWIVALSPPLVHYAGLVFTEVPAALAVALGLRHARGATAGRALLAGGALAMLPWLNVRYAILTAVLLAFALLVERGRRAWAWLAPAAASALAIAAYHFALYGFFDPRRVYGRRPELSLAWWPTGLPGLLFDQEFGLLVYAPVFAMAAAGAIALWRIDRRLAVTAVVLVIAVMAVAGAWPMWRGGFNPPARFLVPVIPALALMIAARWRERWGAAAALLVAWGLWISAVGTWDRALVHRDRDGTAPLFRTVSGAQEWTRLLPGYVLDESARDRLPLTAIWAVALTVAVVASGRTRAMSTTATVAAASSGLLVAAGAAALASTSRAGGREAVRVAGRPALAVPGWRIVRRAVGEWDTSELGWGPLYEPHRAPAGALLGDRLALPPGAYLVTIEGETVPGGAGPPDLLAGNPPRINRLAASQDGWTGAFSVPAGERGTTLSILGGAPLIVRRIRLEGASASTFSDAAGPTQGEERTAHAAVPGLGAAR